MTRRYVLRDDFDSSFINILGESKHIKITNTTDLDTMQRFVNVVIGDNEFFHVERYKKTKDEYAAMFHAIEDYNISLEYM